MRCSVKRDRISMIIDIQRYIPRRISWVCRPVAAHWPHLAESLSWWISWNPNLYPGRTYMHVDSLQEQFKKFIQFDNRGYLIVMFQLILFHRLKLKTAFRLKKKELSRRRWTKIFKIPCIASVHVHTPVIQINCARNICQLTHCFGFFSFGIKNRKFKLCSDFGFVARNEKEIEWQVVFALLIQSLRIHSQTPRNQLLHQLTRLLSLAL